MEDSEIRDEKEITKTVLEYIKTCLQFSSDNVDYHFFTDSIRELSGATFVGLTLVSQEDQSTTIVKAVSGAPELLSSLMNMFGSNLEGTE